MTEYGLQPSYAMISSRSSYGPHSSTIPTKQWLPTSITGAIGSYVNWNGVPIDAEDMWDGYTSALADLMPTTSHIDLVTLFDWDTGLNKFFPVATKTYAVTGTFTPASPNKAVSMTMNIRTQGGAAYKAVVLDYVLGAAEFNKITLASYSAEMIALSSFIRDDDNAFSGRDNTKPSYDVSVTFDLNQALRKQYRMI